MKYIRCNEKFNFHWAFENKKNKEHISNWRNCKNTYISATSWRQKNIYTLKDSLYNIIV